MAALLVTLNIMAILLAVALPVWNTMVKREKEAELIWRGGQYARAIELFRRKYANAYPPTLDILLTERFLRKKYKDPMTREGEFQLLYAGQQVQVPIGGNQPTPPSDQQPRGPAGARGGIIGVASKSTDSSLRVFNGRSKYNEWAFTPQTVLGNRPQPPGEADRPGDPRANRPGMNPRGTQGPGGLQPGFTITPGQPPGGSRPPGTRPPL